VGRCGIGEEGAQRSVENIKKLTGPPRKSRLKSSAHLPPPAPLLMHGYLLLRGLSSNPTSRDQANRDVPEEKGGKVFGSCQRGLTSSNQISSGIVKIRRYIYIHGKTLDVNSGVLKGTVRTLVGTRHTLNHSQRGIRPRPNGHFAKGIMRGGLAMQPQISRSLSCHGQLFCLLFVLLWACWSVANMIWEPVSSPEGNLARLHKYPLQLPDIVRVRRRDFRDQEDTNSYHFHILLFPSPASH